MYAVIKTGGKQYRVAENDVLIIERLTGEAGGTIEFTEVLMLGEGYHNNHHKNPSRANFAAKKGEFDFCYPAIVVLKKCGVIKMTAQERMFEV